VVGDVFDNADLSDEEENDDFPKELFSEEAEKKTKKLAIPTTPGSMLGGSRNIMRSPMATKNQVNLNKYSHDRIIS
jgi:hypothetical protein